MPELVRQRPRRLAGLGDRPAVQGVPLRAPLHRDHQRGVVQAVSHPQQLDQSRRDARVAQELAERLPVRLCPREHPAHIESSRRAFTRLPPVERGGAQGSGALVQLGGEVRVDRRVRGAQLRVGEDVAQHEEAVEVEQILLLVREAAGGGDGGRVVLVAEGFGGQ
eukprot:CAMPEP_0195607188 /NCGR_PEP_ID=MMETSP0815-20121206/8081_1 /TAXON_ID=97485 /ORGANISM="Prymnesium parvum, Strain Texoma1" /LENGTH=164 /DNA_ID=CAMNT_0040746971 /DNA_START=583 /DNA_END=1074 /DNA_ORIENTATION=-